jgi:hypothetical protein
LVAALLTGAYYLLKKWQECGSSSLISCIQQAISAETKSFSTPADAYKREREEAERRLRIAEEARIAAEGKRAAEDARRWLKNERLPLTRHGAKPPTRNRTAESPRPGALLQKLPTEPRDSGARLREA